MTRFPPIAESAMTAAQAKVAAEIASSPRGGVRGPFVALLHNPELARHVHALGNQLRFDSRFPDDLRELAVLVTARKWACQHAWDTHRKLALAAGLDEEVISALAERRTPAAMSEDQQLVHAFATQVNAVGSPDDEVFRAAQARFGLDGAMELIVVCGFYSLLAMVLNSSQPSSARQAGQGRPVG